MTQDDLGPQKDKIADPKKNIRSGFKWMGIASGLAQGLDAISLFLVMLFITDKEMGLATLAVAYAACVETFNACGVGRALVQDDKLTVDELHSLFWFATCFGIALSLIMAICVWPVALFFNSENPSILIPLMLAGVLKLAVVSAANVPLQLINRRLEYHKISIITTAATFVASLLKIGGAAAGLGSWALVLANLVYGICILIGSFLFARYVPALHFKWKECERFIKFGIKMCFSTLGEVLNRNLHYFIVQKVFGESILGLYRVGYELAMSPAIALLNVVNQSSYPVFARVRENRRELSELFHWNQGNIAIFCAVPVVFIFFCAEDIFSIIKDGKWMLASEFIAFVLGVAFVKSLLQTFPEVYKACGFPGLSIKASVAEAILVLIFFCASLGLCHSMALSDIVSLRIMLCSWMLLFIPLFLYHCRLARQFIDIDFGSTIKSVSRALLFLGISSAISAVPWLFRDYLPFAPWLHMGIEVVILLICLGVYIRCRKQVK